MSKQIIKDVAIGAVLFSVAGGVIIGMMLLAKSGDMYMAEYANDDKKKSFNKGNSFRCYENVFDNKKRLVRKSDGWSVYKKTFKKDSLLLPIYRCEEETEF